MAKIIVAGAAGRMGRMIIAAAAGDERFSLSGAFEKKGHEAAGRDAGLIAGVGSLGVSIADDPQVALDGGEVLIDFTAAGATVENARLAVDRGLAMVIGTTGMTEGQKDAVAEASGKVPIVFSPNMSVGVNLTFKVIAEVARVLGEDYDIEIIEAHHRMKKDSPSGTAVRMLEVLADARGLKVGDSAVYGRQGMVGPRPSGEIGVLAVRGGDIVGEHTVLFAGQEERIEITHRAHSRATFARGALRAALWVRDRRAGLYDMADVLELK